MIALLLAVTMQPSLTLELLQAEAERGGQTVSETFDGGRTRGAAQPVKAAPSGGNPSYHFKGSTPVQGISIYTPVKDERGDEGTTRDPAANPLAKLGKYTRLAGAVGLLGLIAGFFVPALWIVGGAGLGAAAVMWFLGKKLAPKKD